MTRRGQVSESQKSNNLFALFPPEISHLGLALGGLGLVGSLLLGSGLALAAVLLVGAGDTERVEDLLLLVLLDSIIKVPAKVSRGRYKEARGCRGLETGKDTREGILGGQRRATKGRAECDKRGGESTWKRKREGERGRGGKSAGGGNSGAAFYIRSRSFCHLGDLVGHDLGGSLGDGHNIPDELLSLADLVLGRVSGLGLLAVALLGEDDEVGLVLLQPVNVLPEGPLRPVLAAVVHRNPHTPGLAAMPQKKKSGSAGENGGNRTREESQTQGESERKYSIVAMRRLLIS